MVPGQALIVTNKHIEVRWSNTLERNTHHGEEQAMARFFGVRLINTEIARQINVL